MSFTIHIIPGDNFHEAWLNAVKHLISDRWESRNLIVRIEDSRPDVFNEPLHQRIENFSASEKLLGAKHVAYTIFPHGLYERKAQSDANRLFDLYNKEGGFYQRIHHRNPREWGTYFRSMTHHIDAKGRYVNQLQNAINLLQKYPRFNAVCKIHIEGPNNNMKARGIPCLNYLTLQNCRHTNKIGMLAVYRNHDFLKRAYGNYWGLCNLLTFIAENVGKTPGPITCISSHAYVDVKKRALKQFVESLPEGCTNDTEID